MTRQFLNFITTHTFSNVKQHTKHNLELDGNVHCQLDTFTTNTEDNTILFIFTTNYPLELSVLLDYMFIAISNNENYILLSQNKIAFSYILDDDRGYTVHK